MKAKSVFCIISTFAVVILLAKVNYAYDMQYPFRDENGNAVCQYKTQNFSSYRKYSNGGEEFHNGVDLDCSFGGETSGSLCGCPR